MKRFTSGLSTFTLELACAAVVLSTVTCAPLPTRSLPAVAPKRAPAVNWLSKNPRGELVAPRTVEVHLTDLDGVMRLAVKRESKDALLFVPLGAGVAKAVDDGSEKPGFGAATKRIQIDGPVEIEGRTHLGVLSVERHPITGLCASVSLPLETYIAGVVAAEVPIWSAQPAELEALAIAARTFAVSAIAKRRQDGKPARLTDGVMDQAYRGTYLGTESSGAQAVAHRLREAIARTTGFVVVRGDRLEETRYHAACGGHTASFADVFEPEVLRYDAHGPTGVPCAPCAERAAKEQAERGPDPQRPLSWVTTVEPGALARAGAELGLGGAIRELEPTRKDAAGRWLEVRVASASQTKTLRFDELRAALGYTSWKSGMIDVLTPAAGTRLTSSASLRVQGRGRGHGVGLCQESTRDYARAGWSAEQILKHYYPGTQVQRIEQMVP